jgi:hypothetical protein
VSELLPTSEYVQEMDGLTLSAKDCYFKLFKNGSKVDIGIYINKCIKKCKENAELYNKMALLLLDDILGIHDVKVKVASIDIFYCRSEPYQRALTLEKLKVKFDTIYSAINK